MPDGDPKAAAVRSNAVAEIDPGDGSLHGQAALDGPPSAIAVAPGAIWVAGDRDGTVSRIDPETHTVRATVPVGHGQSTLAADRGGVWVANRDDGTLTRISSATNARADRIRASNPTDICQLDGWLWVAGAAAGAVLRVDPETHARRAVPLGGNASALACGAGGVWADRRRAADADRSEDRLGEARGRRRHRGRGSRRRRRAEGVGREPADRDRLARGSGARRRDGDLHAGGGRRAGRAGRERRGRLGREPASPDRGAHRPRADRGHGGVPPRPRSPRARRGGRPPLGGGCRHRRRSAGRHPAYRLPGRGRGVRAGRVRPGHLVHGLGVGGAHHHLRRPDRVPAGRRQGGQHPPAQPRRVIAHAVGRRPHVRVQVARGRALLDRPAGAAERREARHRAVVARRAAGLRPAGRDRLDHRRRRRRDDRVPSQARGPGLPPPPRAPVRLGGAPRHAGPAGHRGGDRAVPDRRLQAGQAHPARAQPLLPAVVRARATGRLPGRDRREA